MTDALSDDEAISLLMSAPEPEAAPEPAAPEAAAAPETVEPQSEAEPTAEDAHAPETASEEAPSAETLEAAPTPSIEAPHFWDAPAKARFAQLPPDLQSVVLEQTKNGERAVTKAQQDAAETRRLADEARTKAEAESTSFADLNRRLGEHVTDKKAEFDKRWEPLASNAGAGWVQLARENPDQYAQALAMFNAETGELQRLDAVKRDAETKAKDAETTRQTAWATSEAEKLRTLMPEMADPAKAPAIMGKLTTYGAKYGVTPDQLRNVDALTLSLAHKAMLYDELQATARNPAARTPAPATPQARPAAAPAAPAKTSASALLAKGRQAGALSDDDAMALLLSGKG